MKWTQLSILEGLPPRQLWRYRMTTLSRLIKHGNLHLACLVVSMLAGIAIHSFRIKKAPALHSRGINRQIVRGSAYTIAQSIVCAVILALSLCLSTWKVSTSAGYLFFLSLAQPIVRSEAVRTTICHQFNFLLSTTTLLEATEMLLPLSIIGSHSRSTTMEMSKLLFLALNALIVSITPRQMWPKESNVADLTAPPSEAYSPEETCSWFSYYLSYDWLTYLILRGFSRDLHLDDLPVLPSYDDPLQLLERMTKVRMRTCRTFYSLVNAFRWEIGSIMAWSVLTATVEYVAAFSMFNLLNYLEAPESTTAVIHPFVWIALLFIGPMTRSVCYQRSIFKSTRLMVLWRATLLQELYQKMLDYRNEDVVQMASPAPMERFDATRSTSVNIESLASYDADMVSNASDMFYAFTASLVSTAVAMTFLYQLLGWPSLFGIGVMASMTPLPAICSHRLSRLHRHVMEATDLRLGRITEYLHSIRTLKYFAWEAKVVRDINNMRHTEQERIWKRNLTSILVSMTGDMMSLVSLLAMFASLILFTNRKLHAPVAFTSMAITETLRAQLVWLCKVIQWVSQARGSLKRIDDFLDAAGDRQRHQRGPPAFYNATVRWSACSPFRVHHISLAFREGGLNVITGSTGTGKSLLLMSLLGETTLESGKITCPTDIAYVPQAAWLQNTSIRANILFYNPYNVQRYNAVLYACDLLDDLRNLPLGDLTQVGERGSALSGGQKQRISLARALYSSASTLLLDDIFSALDANTTSLVYDRCFHTSLLTGRTVILVTHLASALQDAASVVSLDERDRLEAQVRKPRQQKPAETTKAISQTPRVESMKSRSETEVESSRKHSLEDIKQLSDERQASGRIPRIMILKYMVLFGSVSHAVLAIIIALFVQLAYFSIALWLSIWTNGSVGKHHQPLSQKHYLQVYAGTVFCFVWLQFSNNYIFQRGGWHAARTLHQRLIHSIVKAPISWFDHTPIGQILNRFGLDTQSMDAVLIDWLRMTLDNALRFMLRLVGIASIMPLFALPAGFFCLVGFATGELYSRAEISVKRIVAIKFAPVLSLFNETSSGLAVIRAGRSFEAAFQRLLAERLAQHMRAAETQFNCNRWVSVRSDFCAATIATTAGCIAYYKSGSAGLVGFSLTNAIGLSQTILTLVRNMNELEVELNSFQRIYDYSQIEPEERPETEALLATNDIPASWPASGKVEIRDLKVRYGENQADVLQGINFYAEPGERIAIIGRTGSGKSTLGLSFLRSTYLSAGQILIDGIDIAKIPLVRLRKAISLVPQDTMLFSGDARSNMDPFGEMDQSELHSVLQRCDLTQQHELLVGNSGLVRKNTSSILMPIASGGKNLSSGQRQIFGLARAMCRRSKLIIMDEATASVDHETDTRMQRLIRSEFAGSTVITIAHRLRTVMDYDRVVVMSKGRIVEMGPPSALIKAKGTFQDMLMSTGEYDDLINLMKL